MTVTELEHFLRNPPAGFSVAPSGPGHIVDSDPEENLVLIGGPDSCSGDVFFQKSLGR